jgi:hypothetical protein
LSLQEPLPAPAPSTSQPIVPSLVPFSPPQVPTTTPSQTPATALSKLQPLPFLVLLAPSVKQYQKQNNVPTTKPVESSPISSLPTYPLTLESTIPKQHKHKIATSGQLQFPTPIYFISKLHVQKTTDFVNIKLGSNAAPKQYPCDDILGANGVSKTGKQHEQQELNETEMRAEKQQQETGAETANYWWILYGILLGTCGIVFFLCLKCRRSSGENFLRHLSREDQEEAFKEESDDDDDDDDSREEYDDDGDDGEGYDDDDNDSGEEYDDDGDDGEGYDDDDHDSGEEYDDDDDDGYTPDSCGMINDWYDHNVQDGKSICRGYFSKRKNYISMEQYEQETLRVHGCNNKLD